MRRKGFDLEINTTVKIVGFVLIGLILAGFIMSDFISGNILNLTDEIGFGDSQYEHQQTVYPKGREWGGIVFGVDHKPIDDLLGGNEIKIQMIVRSNMNITANLYAKLYKEDGSQKLRWPSSGYRDLRPTRGWDESMSTKGNLDSRGHYDGNGHPGPNAYNVTLYMELGGSDELIAFYNATDDEVPGPQGCWVCTGPII